MGSGFQQFEDLRVWQSARELYNLASESFGDSKKFFFRDQILRASLSVSNNIAEGFERKTNKEWIYFLFVAKGSCGEVRSMLYLAADQKMIDKVRKDEIMQLVLEISKMLGALITASQRRSNK